MVKRNISSPNVDLYLWGGGHTKISPASVHITYDVIYDTIYYIYTYNIIAL